MDITDALVEQSNFSKTQVIRKNAVTSNKGIVAAQHRLAAMSGAAMLSRGGNAIDAAIATSFALGVVEPWMSGPGGGGAMVIYKADEQKTSVIDFNMRSPTGLDPADYPLVEGTAADLFPWTRVREDRNLMGPTAIAVPGLVAGMGMAHDKHATMPWAELLQPSITLAKKGPLIDWYTSLLVTASVTELTKDPMAANVFLRNGLAPATPWTALTSDRLDMSVMAGTLAKLADAGPREFYEGETGRQIAGDVMRAGGSLSFEDLQNYHAVEREPLVHRHGEAELFLSPELTAGSTMAAALNDITMDDYAAVPGAPSAEDYLQIARGIQQAQETRLDTMGDVAGGRTQTCTTNFAVVDKWGNMVVVTQTLLSIFGSKVMLPSSGLLMNNGILWFDPEPDKPNSIAPDKRCLTNVCPVIGVNDGRMFGVGASGGRKIMSSVLQLTTFLTDFGMSLEDAFHQARIDCSTSGHVIIDELLAPEIEAKIGESYSTVRTKRTVNPYAFACPSGVMRQGGENYGMTEIMSPWGDAVRED